MDWRAKAHQLFPTLKVEIDSSDSPTMLWIELAFRFRDYYLRPASPKQMERPDFVRSICLYAVWCTKSGPPEAREPAAINFYEDLSRFAIQSGREVRELILSDLIVNLGLPEVEDMAKISGPLVGSEELKRFVADAERVADKQRRHSKKKS
jgi:hypothetical protein